MKLKWSTISYSQVSSIIKEKKLYEKCALGNRKIIDFLRILSITDVRTTTTKTPNIISVFFRCLHILYSFHQFLILNATLFKQIRSIEFTKWRNRLWKYYEVTNASRENERKLFSAIQKGCYSENSAVWANSLRDQICSLWQVKNFC